MTAAGTERPEQFLTSVDEIERDTGLDFMSELEDGVEQKVEAEKAGMW